MEALWPEILGAVPLGSSAVPRVAAHVEAPDFGPRLSPVWVAYRNLHDAGEPITLLTVEGELSRMGELERVGGRVAIAEIFDSAATDAHVEAHARELRRLVVEDGLARVYSRLARDPADELARLEVRRLEAELEAGRRGPLDLSAVGFAGARLRALRSRPEPESPLAGILDPEPHLHVLLGKPKTAKTTLALDLARSWASGSSPWAGEKPLPGTRALVLSREQPVTRLDATIRRLDRYAGGTGRWVERTVIVARDRELAPEARRLLTLDERGLSDLRAGLELARAHGEPFGLVVLDSLSRLKPPGIEERDNDALSGWLDALEELAMACGVWLVLIHHQGHASDPGRSEARSAGRGASAIAAVAQVVLLLERVPENPRLRRLEVDGNAVLPGERFFDVAGVDAEPGAVHFFRPSDPLGSYDVRTLLADGPVSVTELAWRLSGKDREPGKKPAGRWLELAGKLRNRWEAAGIAEVIEGPRNAQMIALALREET